MMSILAQCRNMFGHQISPDCQERIMRFLSDPSYDSWDDIAHIIIAPDGCTVWQAISRLNPTFPAHGRSFDFEGKIIREWEEIPLPIDVVRAIKYCS